MYKEKDLEALQQDEKIISLKQQAGVREELIAKLNLNVDELLKAMPRIDGLYKDTINDLNRKGLKQEEEIKSLREQVCDYQDIIATLNERVTKILKLKWPRIADEYKTERNYKTEWAKARGGIKSLREQVCDYQEIVATLHEKVAKNDKKVESSVEISFEPHLEAELIKLQVALVEEKVTMSIEQSDEGEEEVESLNQELEKYQHKASILSKSTMSQTESKGPHR